MHSWNHGSVAWQKDWHLIERAELGMGPTCGAVFFQDSPSEGRVRVALPWALRGLTQEEKLLQAKA